MYIYIYVIIMKIYIYIYVHTHVFLSGDPLSQHQMLQLQSMRERAKARVLKAAALVLEGGVGFRV